MHPSLLLDTHIAIWLDGKLGQLRPRTKTIIDDCWQNGGTIFLSAVSAWEIANLAGSGRIALDVPADIWVERFLDHPGIAGVELSHRAAARSYQLEMFDQRDPGDRLLIATAIELGCPLVTYDAPIIKFANIAGRQYGFATAQ
jgi:PIN domain nuclease of toxin-antitoxin system